MPFFKFLLSKIEWSNLLKLDGFSSRIANYTDWWKGRILLNSCEPSPVDDTSLCVSVIYT